LKKILIFNKCLKERKMKEFNFKVTEQEANIIIQGLAELPAKISMGLIGKIQDQAKKQLEKNDEDNNNI